MDALSLALSLHVSNMQMVHSAAISEENRKKKENQSNEIFFRLFFLENYQEMNHSTECVLLKLTKDLLFYCLFWKLILLDPSAA